MRKPVLLAVLLAPLAAAAAEGMFTLDNLPRAELEARYGFEPGAKWTEHVMKASVRLAGGCSGSFVSPDGLVLTNAHCVIDCAQSLSDAKHDYVNKGFVAKARGEERACPGFEINRLVAIEDVTAAVNEATAGKDGQGYQDAKHAVQAKLESECAAGDAQATRCDLVELYQGGLYHLYRYQRFQDVRLVLSPEYQAAFFGGDPDNFNFPRYCFDVGLLRVYDGGKPLKSKDYFPMEPAGAREGELAMVTGHPGSTERQLTVAQLERNRDLDLVDTLLYYAERRGMQSQFAQHASAEAARAAHVDLTFTENSFKVFNGELRSLLDPQVFARKRREEEILRAAAAGKPEAGAWDAIAQAQRAWRRIAAPYSLVEKRQGFWSKHFTFALQLVRGADERGKPNGERLPEFQDANLPRLTQQLFSAAPVIDEYEKAKLGWSLGKLRERLGTDDPMTKLVLGKESPEALAARLVEQTRLSDVAVRKALWEGGLAAVAQSGDPFIQLARAVDGPARQLRKQYEEEVEAVERKNAEAIARVRFARLGTSVYPDATFTLRLSYGEVKGWDENGRAVAPFTDFAGLYTRHSGFDPYALPPSFLAAKDKIDPSIPYNFVTTNDITGGNSGSPVINRKAQVVGLAFDGNIHSIGGAFWFDESKNRTVAVHSAAILEVLRKVYGAEALVKELQR